MVFADLIFIYLFLPLNLILYYITKNKSFRNLVLIAFSLFFYSWGEPVWITLLIFSATIDYFHGRIIGANPSGITAKLAVASSLILNIGLLSVFKYGAFFAGGINDLTGLSLPIPQYSLPIGISFYTFQTISYVIDVYRGQVAPQKSFLKFLMFVSLYHQLVAGPIVRYSHIAHEIDHRQVDIRDISTGISRFIIGLTKKVLIANQAGALATTYLDGDLTSLTTVGSWFGISLYALQIYYDFSGYSDMAIGLGRMFGFHYMENFNYPYIAKSATDFWRRWHISLGSFFRDYLYIPLGGNRKHQLLNLLIVWFATGLWHGASVNFILWGLYWGLIITLEKLFLGKLLEKLPSMLCHIYLVFIALLSWVLFYYVDLSTVVEVYKIMFGITLQTTTNLATNLDFFANIYWFIIAIIFATPVVRLFTSFVSNHLNQPKQRFLLWLQPVLNLMLLAISTAMLVGESYNPFLYFRF